MFAITFAFVAVFAAISAFFAQVPVIPANPESDLAGYFTGMLQAYTGGYWILLAFGILALLVWVFQRTGAIFFPDFFGSRTGKLITLYGTAIVTVLADQLALSGGALNSQVIIALLVAIAGASGTHSQVKNTKQAVGSQQ